MKTNPTIPLLCFNNFTCEIEIETRLGIEKSFMVPRHVLSIFNTYFSWVLKHLAEERFTLKIISERSKHRVHELDEYVSQKQPVCYPEHSAIDDSLFWVTLSSLDTIDNIEQSMKKVTTTVTEITTLVNSILNTGTPVTTENTNKIMNGLFCAKVNVDIEILKSFIELSREALHTRG